MERKELNLVFITFCTIVMSNDTQSLWMLRVHNQFYFFFTLVQKNLSI